MKKIIALLALVFCLNVKAQTIVSSCIASDSILSVYKDDADRLTVKRIKQVNSAYKDSVIIPKLWSDTVMNALIAVYNATGLPARNDVIAYNIHTFPNPSLKIIDIAADSNLTWMHQLHNNIIPTGYARIDSLINNYHLHLTYYDTYSNIMLNHVAYFQSDSNYNISALTTLFDSVPGVSYAEVNNLVGDGNDIQSSIYPNYVELTYSYGWDDCESGCISRHFWGFKVYYDCSLEYIGDYGTPLPTTAINQITTSNIKIYPNPSSGNFVIETKTTEKQTLQIFDINGKLVLSQIINGKTNIDASNLDNGMYFIQLKTNENTSMKKIIVQH